MNILQINTTDNHGGAAKVAYSIKKGLEKRGHQSPMLVGRKYSEEPDIKLLNNVRSFPGKVRRKMAYWLANDIDIFTSDHLLKTEEFKKADIVHFHNLHSNYFNLNTLKKISKPMVWTFHDMWPITAHCAHAFDGSMQKNGFFACPSLDVPPAIAWHNEKYLEKIKNRIYKNSNFHIVTPSKWLAGKVKQSVLKDKPLSVIYNGVDINTFKPLESRRDLDKLRSRLDLPLNKHIILIVAKKGQSNPWKGGNYAQEALNALKNRPGAYFVDLGGDTNKTSENVKTVSFIANQETLAKYYSAADMLLYPSIADTCPLVVLEAMACGLPVVSFNTGGIPELVEHKINGYIAEYRNSNNLKDGVEYLLNLSSQEIEKMRQYSIDKTKSNFTVEKMIDQYIELYSNVLKNAVK